MTKKTVASMRPRMRSVMALLWFLAPALGCSDSTGSDEEVPPPPPPPPERVALDPHRHFAQCGAELADLQNVLTPLVDSLVAQKIPYTRQPANEWRDCSGNFLRLSSALAEACPDQAPRLIAPPGVAPYVAGQDNAVPIDLPYRSSRSVAAWYHDQSRFTPIFYDDAPQVTDVPSQLLKHRELLRPGAVVWFSRGRPQSAEGVDALFKKTGTGSHINHMAVVTEVMRDDDGNVVSYKMFHGHGRADKGTPSSVTNRQFFEWPERFLANGSKSYPPLGYWSQRLVGVGTIVPTVTEALPHEVPL